MKRVIYVVVLLIIATVAYGQSLQDTLYPSSDQAIAWNDCYDPGLEEGECSTGHYAVLNETGSADDTDYVETNVIESDDYGCTDTAFADTFNYVILYVRCAEVGGGAKGRYAIYDGTSWSAYSDCTSGTFLTESTQYNTKPSGGSWDQSSVNNIQVRINTDGAKQTQVSWIYVEVYGSTASSYHDRSIGRGIGRGIGR